MGKGRIEVVEITKDAKYSRYLYRCLTGPFRKYARRSHYLSKAIPRGFHKKLLIAEGDVVGQIEYAPAYVSYYPIRGENIIVMHCIWILRRAGGHNLGKWLLKNMIQSEKSASGFATIALKNHWSPWFKKRQIEYLGFKSIRSMNVLYKTKHRSNIFTVYLMWMPNIEDACPPSWNQEKLLEGTIYCVAHPLYRPQTYKQRQILEKL